MTQKKTPQIDLSSGLMLLVLAAIWGGSFFFAEVALKELGPLTIVLHRVFWAVPVLYFFVKWKGIEIPLTRKAWAAYLVMGALSNAIPFSLIFWGQTHIESGLASILNGTTAVFGALVAGVLLVDEPLTPRKIIGALFGVFGVAVIMGLDTLAHLDPRNLGQLAVIAATFSYALGGVWARKKLSGYPPLMNTLGMLTASVAWMIPVTLLTEGVPSLDLSLKVWGALLGLAVVCTSLAFLLYFTILARAGAANVVLVTLLIPPFAITLGVVFLGETLATEAWLGFALIAMGLAITDGRLWARLRGG
uniref:Permease of the drug/metabolite transporter (DMT) superfamily n=1 Tax=uncultured Thiotrichaceae bacterium TaxID=298394 RepID=A0A6S6SEM1_9GAMM|nr:MAG: Permease of the drug/metabolite transporter (DMT) superfamily [uncultured Thiotrichaceae bacterium]